MKIQLKKLILKDFKGIKNLEIDFSEKTNISGDNATGKTTVFDAYSWLLWGKDSLSRKDYEIKPYDVNNEVVHNLESGVTGVFDVDGKEIKFERIYKEVWSKKRGSNAETFTGNTTDFLINDVPMKKKEYEDEIGKIVTEDEFNLLSNPIYFNTILDKKERRDILLSLVKDVNIDDVKEANKELENLDLSNYTIQEIQAMAKASCKKINDKLKEIPARIDELEKTKTTEDFAELEKEIEDLDKNLAGTRNISEDLDKKYKQIADVKNQIIKINTDFDDGKKEKLKDLEEEHADLRRKVTMAEFELNNARKEIEVLDEYIKRREERIAECDNELVKMRTIWDEIQRRKPDESLTCPTCGRAYDGEMRADFLKHFNLEKSKDLEKLSEDGKKINEVKTTYQVSIASYKNQKDEKQAKIDKLLKTLDETMQAREKIQDQMEQVKALSLCDKKAKEINSLEESIKTIEKEIASIGKEDNTQILEQKQAYNERLEEVNSKLSNQGLNAELDKKIKKYMEEEKELGKEFEIQQEKLYLCDEYIKTYTHLVSDKINSLFTKVEFKLFDTQINGGVVETAEATYKGVPYGSLNSAAQINAGLDVINSLSKHYNKEIPIFVDNAESVNELVKTESQLITLTVNKLKNLKIENL